MKGSLGTGPSFLIQVIVEAAGFRAPAVGSGFDGTKDPVTGTREPCGFTALQKQNWASGDVSLVGLRSVRIRMNLIARSR